MKQLAMGTVAVAVVLLFFPGFSAAQEDPRTQYCKEVTNKTISPGQTLYINWEAPTHIIKAGLDLSQLHEDVNGINITCQIWRKNWSDDNDLLINLGELQTIPSQVEIPICLPPQLGAGEILTWKCTLILKNEMAQSGAAIPSSTSDAQWYQSAPGTILVTELEGYLNPKPLEVTPILVAPPATVADPDGG